MKVSEKSPAVFRRGRKGFGGQKTEEQKNRQDIVRLLGEGGSGS